MQTFLQSLQKLGTKSSKTLVPGVPKLGACFVVLDVQILGKIMHTFMYTFCVRGVQKLTRACSNLSTSCAKILCRRGTNLGARCYDRSCLLSAGLVDFVSNFKP